MPTRLTHALGLAAFALIWLGADGALAFSQIDSVEGRSDSREGIIAVPLPPLPEVPGNRNDDARPHLPGEGTDAGEVPMSPEDEAEGEPTDAPAASPDERDGDSPPDAVSPQDPPGEPAGWTPRDPNRPHPEGPASHYRPAEIPATALPSEIAYGDSGLPRPVRDLRARLIAIARSGEIEKLAPYIESGADGTVLSFGNAGDDPIAFLKSASGDDEGIEILAILLEVLQSGHARVEPGTEDEIFVWPYFTQRPIDSLTKPQLVELFELVTAGDYKAMREFGAYNFYRVGISPDGRLEFFVAGD
ncbi:hypothetical protein VQ042_04720 [Aurantimonas sp. A2-1-M11]|uniref:hypothetical protein n=1 Tax=Aurantimonas sp. A2-1-M11 TaxID=3113712 RepID=UPI002F9221C2